jgi:hypothetical protein
VARTATIGVCVTHDVADLSQGDLEGLRCGQRRRPSRPTAPASPAPLAACPHEARVKHWAAARPRSLPRAARRESVATPARWC